MKLIRLPDGVEVNLDQISKISVSGSNVLFTQPDGTDVTYAAADAADAAFIKDQTVQASQLGSEVPIEVQTAAQVTSTATSHSPDPLTEGSGQTMTITGTNLDRIVDPQVYIGDGSLEVQQSVISQTSTTIVVATNVLGLTGTPLDLRIADGVGNTIISASAFIDTSNPGVSVSSFNPASIDNAGGETLEINGAGFSWIADPHVEVDDGSGGNYQEFPLIDRTPTKLTVTTLPFAASGSWPCNVRIKDGATQVYLGVDVLGAY